MANRRRRTSSSFHPEPTSPSGSSGRHPTYHGIRLRAGKWVSEIREPNKTSRIWLGTYPTPEMAAAAYDVAALALKGPYATLNFPDSVLPNTLPQCPTADDIRAAAATAAASKSLGGDTGSGSSHTAHSSMTAAPGGFVEYETVFDTPSLLLEMAQGMLLSPPRIESSFVPEDGSYYYSGGGNLWDY